MLITTPESLFLLLTSKARESLAGVETVILDEVHAVAGTKRGAHLALSLERLDALLERPAQRVGLSATVRPVEEVARFLAGGRPVTVVQPPSTKEWDLEVVVPIADMSAIGTTTWRSHSLVDGGCTTVTGRPPARNRATSSTGRTVADSPTRWAGRSSRASSRSRLSARCAPRLVPATACTSSRMTVSTPAQRLAGLGGEQEEQRLRRGDQHVGWAAGEEPAVGRRGVTGPDGDADVGRLEAEPGRRVADADQRRAQVALDVDREGLHR